MIANRLFAAIVIFAFTFIGPETSAQGSGDPPSRVFMEGEDLVYNVRYTFIDLGQVRIKTIGRTRQATFVAYDTRAFIDSYRGIPFVDLHAIFESRMDTTVCSHGFVGKVKQDDKWDFARYTFEYDRHRVIMEMGEPIMVQFGNPMPVQERHYHRLGILRLGRIHQQSLSIGKNK